VGPGHRRNAPRSDPTPRVVTVRAVSARPRIGISSYIEDARWGHWAQVAVLVPYAYVRAVEAAGGRAFVLPPSSDGVEETLDGIDGLVLSGGGDLDPTLYGNEPHPATAGVSPERDVAEMRLLGAALARDMPVLAVCRGSQLLNVLRGGDLVQHLPEVIGDERHKEIPGAFADHEVTLEPESRIAGLLGERSAVKSHHHQGLGTIGTDLREVGWAEDGTTEALEDPAKRFAVGVLWHPEEGEDFKLFGALVDEAARYAAERT
jgi:putative glutamine amidotransferase